jgi:iron complex outermembrane receptor protein
MRPRLKIIGGLQMNNFRSGWRQLCAVHVPFTAFVFSLFSVSAVFGQAGVAPSGPDQGSPSSANSLEEVVVTARRTSEREQHVPMAIEAFSGSQIADRTLEKETDLQSMVPGLTVKPGQEANQIFYVLRGQTLDAQSGSSPGVLPYLNDIALSSQNAMTFFDLDNIQVLKGPQGTLFGRNAVGGAVLYNTAPPTDTLGGYLTVRGGSYDLQEVQGAINIPIIDGKVALRLSGDYVRQAGYVRNLTDGSTLGDIDTKVGRISLLLTPFDGLKNTTVLQYGKYGGTELEGELYSVYPAGFLPVDAAQVYPALIPYLSKQQAQGIYNERLNYTPLHNGETVYAENTTTYELSPHLTLKNIGGFARSNTYTGADLSGAPYPILEALDPGNPPQNRTSGDHYQISQWSEEFQVLGDNLFDDQLKYAFGLYAASETDTSYIPVYFYGGAAVFSQNAQDADRTKAVYFQDTFDMSKLTGISGLSFTTGIRWTWEHLSMIQLPATPTSPQEFYTVQGLGSSPQHNDENSPSWTVGAQYQATPGLLLYIANRGSWRSGNFNGTTTPANNANFFGPEHTYDVEIGTKAQGHIWGREAQLDFDVYNQWSRDVQDDVYFVVNGSPTSFTHNIPRAEVSGVELNAALSATDWLTLGATTAYADARYTDGLVQLFGVSLNFTTYADTPKWTGSVYATVTLPVPSSLGTMSLRADAYSQSYQWFSSLGETAVPGSKLPSYSLVNLRYDWKNIANSKVSLGAYVKNLANREYFQGGYPLGALAGINTAIPGAPRMFGVEATYRF